MTNRDRKQMPKSDKPQPAPASKVKAAPKKEAPGQQGEPMKLTKRTVS